MGNNVITYTICNLLKIIKQGHQPKDQIERSQPIIENKHRC